MFNQNEFTEELLKTNWDDIYDPSTNTNKKFKSFMKKLKNYSMQWPPSKS